MLQECYSRIKSLLKLRIGALIRRTGETTGIHRHLSPLQILRQSEWEACLELGLALLILLFPLEAIAESPHHLGAVQLPLNYETEFAAGSAGRKLLSATAVPLADSSPVADEVWHDLLQDSALAGLKLPFQWQLVLVNDQSVNAWSLPDGEVIVDRKLGNLLGTKRGLWAALLSHEIAHVAHRHWLRRYLFESQLHRHLQDYQNAPAAGIDSRWQMAALGEEMDAPDASSRFARELELEADSEGMMLMARTGFHPDFALAIHHLLGANVEEASGFGARFATHPGWVARDRNGKKIYSHAIEEFVLRWPTAASSPGGAPPTIVSIEGPKSDSGRKNPMTISYSLKCANPGEPLRSVLRVYEQSGKAGAPREAIEYWQPTTCTDHNEKRTLTVTLPRKQELDSKWNGEIVILGSQNVALERSHLFTIHAGSIEPQSRVPGGMAFQDSRPNF
jgi:hypothetical protein